MAQMNYADFPAARDARDCARRRILSISTRATSRADHRAFSFQRRWGSRSWFDTTEGVPACALRPLVCRGDRRCYLSLRRRASADVSHEKSSNVARPHRYGNPRRSPRSAAGSFRTPRVAPTDRSGHLNISGTPDCRQRRTRVPERFLNKRPVT